MTLPDPQSSEAIALLQRAIGHVSVDGALNEQTIKAASRLDQRKFNPVFARLLTAEFGEAPQEWIEAVIGRTGA